MAGGKFVLLLCTSQARSYECMEENFDFICFSRSRLHRLPRPRQERSV